MLRSIDSQPLLRFVPISLLLFIGFLEVLNLHFTAIPRINPLFGHYPIVVSQRKGSIRAISSRLGEPVPANPNCPSSNPRVKRR